MEVYTTENTAVIYTGNYLDEVPVFYSRSGNLEKNKRYMGVTVETQDYPNGINERNLYRLKKRKNIYKRQFSNFIN